MGIIGIGVSVATACAMLVLQVDDELMKLERALAPSVAEASRPVESRGTGQCPGSAQCSTSLQATPGAYAMALSPLSRVDALDEVDRINHFLRSVV